MARQRLPDERRSITHKFTIHSHEYGDLDAYLTVGLYPSGRPGEVFVRMQKEGSTVGALMDQWATAVSILLQYGAEVAVITGKFKYVSFEPCGFVDGCGALKSCSSPIDYVARWLEMKFGAGAEEARHDGGEEVREDAVPHAVVRDGDEGVLPARDNRGRYRRRQVAG